MNRVIKFQERISYRFNDMDTARTALTHSSYANERKGKNISYNERLEFLGDSVLGIVVSDYIFKECPNRPEGELTKLRATIVCEGALAIGAREAELGKYLYLGKGEEYTGGRDRDSVLADAFEAVIGALYLDGGIEHSRDFIFKYLGGVIGRALSGEDLFKDYKTQLQELLQRDSSVKIEYRLEREDGPDHSKLFYTGVYVDDALKGIGSGKSKKESEQNAAKEAFSKEGEDE